MTAPALPARILVIRLSSLGDILLTQPLLEHLSARGARVDLWVKPEFAEMARLLPGPDRVIFSAADLVPRYALVLDAQATRRSRQAAARARGARTVRLRKHSVGRRLLVRPWGRPMPWNRWSPLAPARTRVLDWLADLSERAGLGRPAGEPRLQLNGAERREAQIVLDRQGVTAGQTYFALAPGAAWPTKRWPVESYAEVAREFQARHGWLPVFVGSARERDLCAAAARQAGGGAVLCGEPLSAVAGVLAGARALVTNDSGLLHLGRAAGAPVVLLMGPTVPAFGFSPPPGPGLRILSRGLDCRPCSLHGTLRCPLGHHRCLRDLPPADVVQALDELGKDERA